MKLTVKENKLSEQPEQILRRNGYLFLIDHRTKKESFSKALGGGHYPRLHLYLKRINNEIIFDLHLDQKRASYKGSNMHSAEYEGETVRGELLRLQSLIGGVIGDLKAKKFKNKNNSKSEQSRTDKNKKTGIINTGLSAENKLGKGDFCNCKVINRTKPWWRFW